MTSKRVRQAGGLASIAAATAIWRSGRVTAWSIGAATAAGMGIGFVLSRTVGLPGFHEAEWELSGLVSLVLEAGVMAAAVLWAREILPGQRAGARTMA